MSIVVTAPGGQLNQIQRLLSETQTPLLAQLVDTGSSFVPGIWSITDPQFAGGAVAGAGVSTARRTQNTVAIQAAVDFIRTTTPAFGKGGTLVIPPGVFEINDAIRIAYTSDAIAGICVRGLGGRYSSMLTQVDPTKNVVEVTDTVLNVRGVELADFSLNGGKYGLYLKNAVYDLFNNLTFEAQNTWGVFGDVNVYPTFNNCWFVDQIGNNLLNQGGIWFCNSCIFGEAAGSVQVNSGNLNLTDCYMYDCADNLGSETFGLGAPALYVASGGSLAINGGVYIPRTTNCTMLAFGYLPGAIMVDEAAQFELGSNITHLFREYLASFYSGPMICRGKISSQRSAGLTLYQEISSPFDATAWRLGSAMDVAVTYVGTPPTIGSGWMEPSRNNSARLRPRLATP